MTEINATLPTRLGEVASIDVPVHARELWAQHRRGWIG